MNGSKDPMGLVVYSASIGTKAPVIGVIGDSTGNQLLRPLAERVNPYGVGLVGAVVGGCQTTDLTMLWPETHNQRPGCADIAAKQTSMTAHYHPSVVIWADVMEHFDIKANGRRVTSGGDEWKRLTLAAWDRVLDRLGDAKVVLILPTWWADFPANSPENFSVEKQRELFRSWALRHPDRVTVLDLGPVICPSGPPCQRMMAGVRLRTDAFHYTDEGLRRAVPKILEDTPVLANLLRRPAAHS